MFQTMVTLNCITVNTDASYSHQRQSAGYAFWIKCDLFKIQKGGTFKSLPKNPLEAEMMCIANALHTLSTYDRLPKCKLIVVNSDCLNCFKLIYRKSPSKAGRKVYEIVRELKKKASVPKVEFRHVKAHSGKGDARSYVNEWCDTEAKKWMRGHNNSIKDELNKN